METEVLYEAGHAQALLSLSLSYNQDPKKMDAAAKRLAFKGGGESKFLESVML